MVQLCTSTSICCVNKREIANLGMELWNMECLIIRVGIPASIEGKRREQKDAAELKVRNTSYIVRADYREYHVKVM